MNIGAPTTAFGFRVSFNPPVPGATGFGSEVGGPTFVDGPLTVSDGAFTPTSYAKADGVPQSGPTSTFVRFQVNDPAYVAVSTFTALPTPGTDGSFPLPYPAPPTALIARKFPGCGEASRSTSGSRISDPLPAAGLTACADLCTTGSARAFTRRE